MPRNHVNIWKNNQGTEVTLPTSSPFIKFAILPKKIPIGETQAIISGGTMTVCFFCENEIVPIEPINK